MIDRRFTSDSDDGPLVAAAQGGDRRAMDLLLGRHQERIYAICRRLAGNDADALDATQEALIAIVKGIARFDGRSKFSTWSYRVASNACLDELRRRGRRPVPGLPEHETVDSSDTTPSIAGSVTDRIVVDAALDQLRDTWREPVILRDLCGYDYAEISELLDIPPGTVRSRIARGRAELAQILGNRSDSSERQTP